MTTLSYASETIGIIRKEIDRVRDALQEIVPDNAPHYKKFEILKSLKFIEDVLLKEIEEIKNYG